jgi:2,4-dienoyl-CoA reductase-like NADH-dependent reductase (Old Yellow Enzyme family)
MAHCGNVFSPGKIGKLETRNRPLQTAMGTSLATRTGVALYPGASAIRIEPRGRYA